jgi:Fe-S-cluster containining protein
MLRKLVMSFIILDNHITNLVKRPFRTKWKLSGKCNKCGICCQEIMLDIHPNLLKSRFTTDIIVRWLSWAFNFYLKDIDEKKYKLIFGCKTLRKNGTCGDYKWRPNICRNYPIVDFFDEPSLFKTCGYKAKINT